MNLVRFCLIVFVGIFFFGCSLPVSNGPPLTGDEAMVELRSVFGGHTIRPLALQMTSIDGVDPGRWSSLKKKFALSPGRHTLQVTGEFENIRSTVSFTLNARARQTYWIGGQFALRRGGYLKHSYTLRDSAGKVLQRREAVPR